MFLFHASTHDNVYISATQSWNKTLKQIQSRKGFSVNQTLIPVDMVFYIELLYETAMSAAYVTVVATSAAAAARKQLV